MRVLETRASDIRTRLVQLEEQRVCEFIIIIKQPNLTL